MWSARPHYNKGRRSLHAYFSLFNPLLYYEAISALKAHGGKEQFFLDFLVTHYICDSSKNFVREFLMPFSLLLKECCFFFFFRKFLLPPLIFPSLVGGGARHSCDPGAVFQIQISFFNSLDHGSPTTSLIYF